MAAVGISVDISADSWIADLWGPMLAADIAAWQAWYDQFIAEQKEKIEAHAEEVGEWPH